MVAAAQIEPGTKVETGEPGTPSHRVGLVLGRSNPELLGREEHESSVLVSWESGEQEWLEVSLLRPHV